jgi:hypothetical protein
MQGRWVTNLPSKQGPFAASGEHLVLRAIQVAREARMTGEQLVRMLEEDFTIKIGAATKSQWRKKKKISPTIFRNALNKMHAQTLERAIVPIAEYHYLDDDHGKKCRLVGKSTQ